MSGYPAWVYRKTEEGTVDGVIVPNKEAHDALPPGWYGTPDEALASKTTPVPTPTDEASVTEGVPDDLSEGLPDAETVDAPPRRVHRKK